MNEVEVIEISKDAVIVLLKLTLPLMSIALIVGLVISLFQALTQIQEMTLSFVPKIIAVFVSLIVLLPFMWRTISNFSDELMNRIAGLQ